MFSNKSSEFRFKEIADQFNSAMAKLEAPLHFAYDGRIVENDVMTSRDYQIVSFWFAVIRVLDELQKAKDNANSKMPRNFPVWVFTMHPNIIWNRKARKGLIHIYRCCKREEYDRVKGVILDLFKKGSENIIAKGGNISVVEYANLWIETVGSSIFKVAHELKAGQLLTWIGVDCDGSNSLYVNRKKSGKVCQAFMTWTLGKYQSFIRHYRDEADDLANRIHDCLEATKSGVYNELTRSNAYRSPEEFIEDVEELLTHLNDHDKWKTQRFIRKVKTLGFSGLEFQPRVNSASVWVTLRELADNNEIDPSLEKEELVKQLKTKELNYKSVDNEIAKWIFDVLKGYKDILKRTNRMNSIVIANTTSKFDLLGAEILLELVGLGDLEVIPLLEDQDGMKIETIEECTKHVRNILMCGFSDTPRNFGLAMGFALLMKAMDLINKYGKTHFYGRAYNTLRGGGVLERFCQVMGAPKKFISLRQGDDLYFDCIAPETALNSLAPQYRELEADSVPDILIELGELAEIEFCRLVEDEGFNKLWNHISKLSKGLVVSARPSNRSKDGASGGEGWESSRAIGATQTCLGVMAYYVHLFGIGKVYSAREDELRALYESGNPHVIFILDALKELIPQVRMDHFSKLAKGFISDELIKEIGSDFWALRHAIREITSDQGFRTTDPTHLIVDAYNGILELARKDKRSPKEDELLSTMLHCVLSYYHTSG